MRAAILALWLQDQRKAARDTAGGWLRSARLEGTGGATSRAGGWRASAGFMQPGVLGARRVGRGDTR